MDGNEIVSKAMDDFSQWEKYVSETTPEELVGEWDAMSSGMRLFVYGETDSDLLEELKRLKKEVGRRSTHNTKMADRKAMLADWYAGSAGAYEWMYGRLVAIVSQSQ